MKRIIAFLFCLALFITGGGVGLSINVFMVRGAPVINSGGELLMLLAIPAAVFAGYRLGRKRKNKVSEGGRNEKL